MLLMGCLAGAQKTAARGAGASYKLVAVRAAGSQRYTPEEIVAASGLQVGQTVSEDDFKRASERLGQCGAFSDVSYRYEYSGDGATLDFQVADSTDFVPVHFENFVWLSDQELYDRLHERVPLFHGDVPLAGDLADQVSDALQALLIEHHIEGKADYLRAGNTDGPVTALEFSVTGPKIQIRKFVFEGAGFAELPLLQAASQKLASSDYNRTILQKQVEKDFLPIYLELGYLKATFPAVSARVVESNADGTLVDVNVKVEPGHSYTLGSVKWSGNTVFPAGKLKDLIHIQPGQPANQVELEKDITEVRDLYGTRGYMTASVQPEPEMADEKFTVNYDIHVNEGDVYHMGELEIRGVDTNATNHLVAAWTLRQGDTYDSSYPTRFLADSANPILHLVDWNTDVHADLDEKDRTVDVTLRFDPKPTR